MLSLISDRSELTRYLNNLYSFRTKRPVLKAIILNSKITPENFSEIMKKRFNLGKKYIFNLHNIDEDLFFINLTRLFKNRTIKGNLILDTSKRDIWILISDENDEFINLVAKRFFKHFYPNISNIYFNTDQIKYFLDELGKIKNHSVKINYFASKIEPKLETILIGEYKKGTIMHWRADAEKEIEDLTKSYVITITHINFKLYDEKNMLYLEGLITRKGECQLKYGTFSNFYEIIIINAIKIGYDLKKFYGNRDRSLREGYIELKPFQIYYKEIFNKAQLKRLERKLSTSYLCSTIHDGNPYFAANVSDAEDGSSFGVTVLRNTVTITPIIKASTESTWKLTNEIQEILGDGRLADIEI